MRARRVLLKLSGESLSKGGGLSPISVKCLSRTANEIRSAVADGRTQLAVVIGAGNLWRGAGSKFIERVAADQMGILATIMNSLALNDALTKAGMQSKIFSASGVVSNFVENFNKEKVIECIERGNIIIFAGGTGNPFFTTDTAAVLRAAEIEADVLLKATQVDGVYDADPKKNKAAVKFDSLTFQEALDKRLEIMDFEAFSLCMRMNRSITVFDFYKDNNLKKILDGEKIGTIVGGVK
ncbi:uridylate kinase [Endomicrobiia bacterium]|nr:uridylate kinase [Endomicrobiia bacterium]